MTNKIVGLIKKILCVAIDVIVGVIRFFFRSIKSLFKKVAAVLKA